MTGTPARRYTWPPFAAENDAAERHGAYAERKWRPLADRLTAEVTEVAPWLSRPAFRLAVEAWSIVEAKATLVDNWLDEHGLLDAKGIPFPANALADRLAARAITLRGQLGLDPVSFARLLATFAGVVGGEDALAALKREGTLLVEAHTAALAPGNPGDDAADANVSDPEPESLAATAP